MALIIHRGARPRSERLVLVGGDGRWTRPLLRLAQAMGFATTWLEGEDALAEARMDRHDLLVAADVATARRVLAARAHGDAHPPMVVLTGSLHSLSTPVPRSLVPLPLPITLESLAEALGAQDLSDRRAS
ncbi:MAG: hypothetical protein AAFU79_19575 [Myxococcota bacterium]